MQGKAYGTAVHKAMQYLDFADCGTPEEISEALDRLQQRGLLTEPERKAVSEEKLMKFFSTDLGIRVRRGDHVLREFKFSILDDAAQYGEGLEGESVLLQGVVDCALLDEDGIIVLDFKTDYVTPENRDVLIERYRHQVQAYARSLARIFEKPVKAVYLYSFHLEDFLTV